MQLRDFAVRETYPHIVRHRGDRDRITIHQCHTVRDTFSIYLFMLGASKPLPSVYIQMDLKFTWSDFCLLETYFKTKLAEVVIQDDGTPIMYSQVYLNNFDENCPAPKNSTDVSLLFYVVKPNGGYRDVDVNLTINAYKVLHYLVENKLGRMLGPLFELKVSLPACVITE